MDSYTTYQPRRSHTLRYSSTSYTPPSVQPVPTHADSWTSRLKAKGALWGRAAATRGTQLSDNVGGRVNSFAERKFGTEHFWPVTGDFGDNIAKAARILRAFTTDGVETTDKETAAKILRKIPSRVIFQAKGLAIFTSMRSGIAPLGHAGGVGIVIARLPGGGWSAPAAISPQNVSAGFLLGVDVYDCILVIRTQEALDSFGKTKFTLGSEIGIAAGPWGGAGAAVEVGKEGAPVLSYVRSRGLYAGVEITGTSFIARSEENAAFYKRPDITPSQILAGHVLMPPEGQDLLAALEDASSGRAQRQKLHIDAEAAAEVKLDLSSLGLTEGEVLKLPPLPDMTDGQEGADDPDTERVIRRSRPTHLRAAMRHSIHGMPTPVPATVHTRLSPLASPRLSSSSAPAEQESQRLPTPRVNEISEVISMGKPRRSMVFDRFSDELQPQELPTSKARPVSMFMPRHAGAAESLRNVSTSGLSVSSTASSVEPIIRTPTMTSFQEGAGESDDLSHPGSPSSVYSLSLPSTEPVTPVSAKEQHEVESGGQTSRGPMSHMRHWSMAFDIPRDDVREVADPRKLARASMLPSVPVRTAPAPPARPPRSAKRLSAIISAPTPATGSDDLLKLHIPPVPEESAREWEAMCARERAAASVLA